MRLRDWLDDFKYWLIEHAAVRRVATLVAIAVSGVTTYHHIDLGAGARALQDDADRAPSSVGETTIADTGPPENDFSAPSAPKKQLPPLKGSAPSLPFADAQSPERAPAAYEPPEASYPSTVGHFLSTIGARQTHGFGFYANPATLNTITQGANGQEQIDGVPGEQVSFNQGVSVPTGGGAGVISGSGAVGTSGITGSSGSSSSGSSGSGSTVVLGAGASVGFLGSAQSNGEISTGTFMTDPDPLLEGE